MATTENVVEYDEILDQYNKLQQSNNKEKSQQKKVTFDVKNYLNVRLGDKETEKELTIRLLPINSTSKTPFKTIKTHYLASQKTNYICAHQTEGLPEGTDTKCPFCDLSEQAKLEQVGADKAKWEKLKKVYTSNLPSTNYVVRVVDRDDEEFGVKFWKFTQPVYEMLLDLYKSNKKKKDINIFDENEGKDLTITIKKKEGKNKITSIIADDDITPLASTTERINELMNDEKNWYNVYTVKPYDYLSILIEGKEPFFDKELNKWVEKKSREELEQEANELEVQYEEEEGYVDVDTSNGEADDLPF